MRALFLALTALAAPLGAALPSRRALPLVVIDPGHGGEDAGAEGGKGVVEKDLCLELAQRLQGILERSGFQVVLTRPDDTFLPLADRAKVANEAGADLFVSLHVNASRSRGAKGSEVYFLSLDQGDEDARAVAATENGPSHGPAAPGDLLASILDDMAQKAYLAESQDLAVAVQQELNQVGGIRERGVKQAPFAVLRRAAMPAVLVEAGFISNPKESRRLLDPDFQRKLAEAMTRGIRQFLARGQGHARRKTME